MKLLLIGGAALIGIGTVAMAQMGDTGADAAGAAPQVEDGNLELGQSEEDRAAERDYLETYLGDLPDVSEIEPIEGVLNEPYRTCEKTDLMKANVAQPGEAGHRAQRDIDFYLSAINVVSARNCTCATKIVPEDVVLAFEDRLKAEYQVAVLEPKHTRDIYKETDILLAQAEKLCGGDF